MKLFDFFRKKKNIIVDIPRDDQDDHIYIYGDNDFHKYNRTFMAIDFETATPQRSSACQLGLAIVENGIITKKELYLIQPPDNKYNARNTTIHGISSSKTLASPTFDEVWKDIKKYFDQYDIVCHNASFDIDVLKQTCRLYNIPLHLPHRCICTFKITGKPLIEACQAYHIRISGHHNALSDAVMCARLYDKICQGIESDESNIRIRKGGRKEYDENNVSKCSNSESNEFCGKSVVVTGALENFSREEIRNILTNKGAYVKSSISCKTEIVIIGIDPGPVKMDKIKYLTDNGCSIQLLEEDQLMKILKL